MCLTVAYVYASRSKQIDWKISQAYWKKHNIHCVTKRNLNINDRVSSLVYKNNFSCVQQ